MKRNRNERGAAVVELAVVLPVLVLILLSMVDFGRYFYVRINLSSATFEVADAVSRGLLLSTDTQVDKQNKILTVISDVSPGIAGVAQLQSTANLTIDPLPDACPNNANQVTVTVSTPFNSISPISNFFNSVSSSASMRCLR